MLDGYFLPNEGPQKRQRMLAVQAALEIAKASVGSSDGSAHSRVNEDLKGAAETISLLADAIQAALNK